MRHLGLAVCALLASSPAMAGEALEKALGAPDWLKIDVTHRLRYESLHNTPFVGRRGDDQLISPATWLKIEIGDGPVKFVGEAVDARGYLDDAGSGLSSGTIDPIDLLQAHLAFKSGDVFTKGDKATLLAGRFTTQLGAGRIIGKNSFRNVTDSFTGFRADWTSSGGTTATVIAALPLVRLPNDAAGLAANRAKLDDQDFDLQLYAAQTTGFVGYTFSASAPERPTVGLVRGRGTAAAPTIVSSGDTLGTIYFAGNQSSSTSIIAAEIDVFVDGTPGAANDMPGRMVFSTT
ncbi:MAG: alginate export family protein, partial [Parvularculaceae bacterium]|nr:alginate export family protein [Parvularculaceae bacterium]